MAQSSWDTTRYWLFDLDDTLYRDAWTIFRQVDHHMLTYMTGELGIPRQRAAYLKEWYYERFGLTMTGLMRDYAIDPEDYLKRIHDVRVDHLRPNTRLRSLLQALPGPCYVLTNSEKTYAHRVLHALGIADCFQGVFDIVDGQYQPKPSASIYQACCDTFGLSPSHGTFFDDRLMNVEAAIAVGMQGVLIADHKVAQPNMFASSCVEDALMDIISSRTSISVP